jgi:hypothetical protein
MSLNRDQLAAALYAVEEIGANSTYQRDWYAAAADAIRAEMAALARTTALVAVGSGDRELPRTYMCWIEGDPYQARHPVIFHGAPSKGDLVRIKNPDRGRDIVAEVVRRYWEDTDPAEDATIGPLDMMVMLRLDTDLVAERSLKLVT